MANIRLIKSVIDRLPTPQENKRVEYFDTELPGFGIRVTESSMIYFVLSRVNGQLIRYTIGKHGVKTPDEARKEAREKLVMMANGINPNREKALARIRGITLKQAMEEYFTAKPLLREGSKKTYKCLLNLWLSDWMNRPLDEIGKSDVSKKHLKIASERSPVAANNVMRTFRAIYNHAQEISDGTLPENPTRRLSQSRQWFQVGRRQTVIKEHELKTWYDAVKDYSNPVVSDALLLLLFTGCRKEEVLTLQWSDVDMEDRTFTIRAEIAKNHREHTLPMSDMIFDIFNQRLALRENEWVFPGQVSKGHLTNLNRAVATVTKKSEIDFCIHDLRRTFTSIAEQEVSYAVLKRLLNHSTGNDVTAGYLIISTEQLREPMQKITNRIMKACRTKETRGKVIPFRT
jgi:integrase